MITQVETNHLPRTMAEFLEWEQPTDGYKYEWNDGELIKFDKKKKRHLPMITLLNQRFYEGSDYKHNKGVFVAEQAVSLTGIQTRIPDLAYFSREQIKDSQYANDEPIPPFVIEIISPTDDIEKSEMKLSEYFKAGVEVVWHIFPENQIVYVYTSRKTVKICMDDDICSAAPVLNDFEIPVNQLFAEYQ